MISQAGLLVLAPNPVKVGMPVCLFSPSRPEETHWQIYGIDRFLLTKLDFYADSQQCWNTAGIAPGLYIVKIELISQGQRSVKVLKVAVEP